MKYERLTPKDKKFHWTLQNHEYINKLFDRLAELEDKIESGQAVILPCKVGDKIYVIYQDYANKNDYAIFCEKVDEITISQMGVLIHSNAGELYNKTHDIKSFGDTVFTIKEAAEEKLKELKGE